MTTNVLRLPVQASVQPFAMEASFFMHVLDLHLYFSHNILIASSTLAGLAAVTGGTKQLDS
eukprot:1158585-Pelagomonas_calceolata.AAC.4